VAVSGPDCMATEAVMETRAAKKALVVVISLVRCSIRKSFRTMSIAY